MKKNKTLKPFWRTKKNGDITFGPLLFKRFLENLGFVRNEDGLVLKIIQNNNSIYPIRSHEDIQDYVSSFLTETNDEHFEEGKKFGIPMSDEEPETWEQDVVIEHWMVKY